MASNPSPQVVQPTYVSPVSPSAAASQSAIISQFGGGGVTGASPTGGTAVTGGVRGEHNTDDPAGLWGALEGLDMSDPNARSGFLDKEAQARELNTAPVGLPGLPGMPGLWGTIQGLATDLHTNEVNAAYGAKARSLGLSMPEIDADLTAQAAKAESRKAATRNSPFGYPTLSFKELYGLLFGNESEAAPDFDPATEFDKRDTEGRFDPSNFGPRGLSPENDPGAFGYGPGGGNSPSGGEPSPDYGGPGVGPSAYAKGGPVTRDRVPGKPTPPGVDDGPVNVDVGEYVVPTWFIQKVGGAKKFEEILKKATGLLPRGAPPRKG